MEWKLVAAAVARKQGNFVHAVELAQACNRLVKECDTRGEVLLASSYFEVNHLAGRHNVSFARRHTAQSSFSSLQAKGMDNKHG